MHIDFAGPFKGRMFFLLIDAHSKWPEIHEMPSTTADRTIAVLRHIFAAYGLPQQVVSDNGPQFTSGEFMDFLQSNGVKHVRTAPYHPSSNGAVERLVQTFKQSMKAGEEDGRPLQHQLQSFLMSYCSTPHATTGVSSASLFLGRPIQTRFDLLRPNLGERVCVSQGKQKSHHDRKGTLREFAVGARVMVRDGRVAFCWVPGTILERRGPVSYVVELDSGVVGRKHVDHIRAWDKQDSDLPSATQTPTPEPIDVLPPVSLPEGTVVAGTDSSVESVSPSQENPGHHLGCRLSPRQRTHAVLHKYDVQRGFAVPWTDLPFDTLGFVLRGEECIVYTDLWFCLLLFVVVLHYYLLLYLVVTAVSAVILSSMSGDH